MRVCSFPEIVSHPEIAMVALYTLDQEQRFNQLLLALKQGKHVLIEHPLVATMREAQFIATLANTPGALRGALQVVQMSQVFPSFIHQHKCYKNGDIGDVEALEVTLIDSAPWSLDSPYNHMRILSGTRPSPFACTSRDPPCSAVLGRDAAALLHAQHRDRECLCAHLQRRTQGGAELPRCLCTRPPILFSAATDNVRRP